MTEVLVVTFVLVMICITVSAVAFLAQKLADWWHEYSMKREFDKMVEKEQRRYRRR